MKSTARHHGIVQSGPPRHRRDGNGKTERREHNQLRLGQHRQTGEQAPHGGPAPIAGRQRRNSRSARATARRILPKVAPSARKNCRGQPTARTTTPAAPVRAISYTTFEPELRWSTATGNFSLSGEITFIFFPCALVKAGSEENLEILFYERKVLGLPHFYR
jgi:hypothetical protein